MIVALKTPGPAIPTDEVGTGPSSPSDPQRCAVDGIKIDRRCVVNTDSDRRDRAVAVIELAKVFDSAVAAKCVETTADKIHF